MPKMKSHKSSQKRFSIKKSGFIKRSKAYKSHILTKKSTKRKRNLRKATTVSAAETSRIRVLLPYA